MDLPPPKLFSSFPEHSFGLTSKISSSSVPSPSLSDWDDILQFSFKVPSSVNALISQSSQKKVSSQHEPIIESSSTNHTLNKTCNSTHQLVDYLSKVSTTQVQKIIGSSLQRKKYLVSIKQTSTSSIGEKFYKMYTIHEAVDHKLALEHWKVVLNVFPLFYSWLNPDSLDIPPLSAEPDYQSIITIFKYLPSFCRALKPLPPTESLKMCPVPKLPSSHNDSFLFQSVESMLELLKRLEFVCNRIYGKLPLASNLNESLRKNILHLSTSVPRRIEPEFQALFLFLDRWSLSLSNIN